MFGIAFQLANLQTSLPLPAMKKWLYKILMFIAVITVIGHNTIPHHHDNATHEVLAHHNEFHDEQGEEPDHDHDEHTDHNHNIFSLVQLDKDFVKPQFDKVCIDLPVLYLATPFISFRFARLNCNSKNQYSIYEEFPPPPYHQSDLFSRPPPIV